MEIEEDWSYDDNSHPCVPMLRKFSLFSIHFIRFLCSSCSVWQRRKGIKFANKVNLLNSPAVEKSVGILSFDFKEIAILHQTQTRKETVFLTNSFSRSLIVEAISSWDENDAESPQMEVSGRLILELQVWTSRRRREAGAKHQQNISYCHEFLLKWVWAEANRGVKEAGAVIDQHC